MKNILKLSMLLSLASFACVQADMEINEGDLDHLFAENDFTKAVKDAKTPKETLAKTEGVNPRDINNVKIALGVSATEKNKSRSLGKIVTYFENLVKKYGDNVIKSTALIDTILTKSVSALKNPDSQAYKIYTTVLDATRNALSDLVEAVEEKTKADNAADEKTRKKYMQEYNSKRMDALNNMLTMLDLLG